jgi:hypothetical protein
MIEYIRPITEWLQAHPQTWPVILIIIQHFAPDHWKINQITRDHNRLTTRLKRAIKAFNRPTQPEGD